LIFTCGLPLLLKECILLIQVESFRITHDGFAGVAPAPNYLGDSMWLKVVFFISTELYHHFLPLCRQIRNIFFYLFLSYQAIIVHFFNNMMLCRCSLVSHCTPYQSEECDWSSILIQNSESILLFGIC
jgi:hypothetical protein